MNLRLHIVLFCVVGGLVFTLPALGAGHFGLWWLSGVITVASLLPVVHAGPLNRMAQFGTIALALVGVGLVCTVSEGYLFVPEVRKYAVTELVGGTVLYLTVATVLVGLAKLWHFSESADHEVVHRSMRWTIPMVFLAGFLYLVFYQVFGSITFYFFTQKYYPHAAELAKTMGLWFWVY